MKDSIYFPHDVNSSNDLKIIRLIQVAGWEGYGLYWALIERLHDAGGWLDLDYDHLAFAMRSQCEILKTVINDFNLFIFNKRGQFASKRALKNLNMRKSRSAKARDSASKRWLRSQCDGNAMAMLERKGKESKEKESKEERKEGKQFVSKWIEAFDQFYLAYPKHAGKEKARESWGSKKTMAFVQSEGIDKSLSVILNAVQKQRNTDQWNKNNGEFIPLPSTWLNQKRWEDEPFKIEESLPKEMSAEAKKRIDYMKQLTPKVVKEVSEI